MINYALRYIQFLYNLPERDPAYPQMPRCECPVAVEFSECGDYVVSFPVVLCRQCPLYATSLFDQIIRQVGDGDCVALAGDGRVFEGVDELTNIAGPVVSLDCLHRCRAETLYALSVHDVDSFEVMRDEYR